MGYRGLVPGRQRLSHQDEAALGEAIQRGLAAGHRLVNLSPGDPHRGALQREVDQGRVATQRFVAANLGLVAAFARRYRATGVPLEDLIQEGNIGLLKAVERYDWRLGFTFSTYAAWWIRQSITRGVAQMRRTIRLPEEVEERVILVDRTWCRLEEELGRPPSTTEVSQASGLQLAHVEAAMVFQRQVVSLDAQRGGRPLSTTLRDDAVDVGSSADAADLSRLVGVACEQLNDRERAVLVMRFGLHDRGGIRPLAEIGRAMRLSAERVRQIEARAMCKLRHPSGRSSALKGSLDEETG